MVLVTVMLVGVMCNVSGCDVAAVRLLKNRIKTVKNRLKKHKNVAKTCCNAKVLKNNGRSRRFSERGVRRAKRAKRVSGF